MTDKEIYKLSEIIGKFDTINDLEKQVASNIKKLEGISEGPAVLPISITSYLSMIWRQSLELSDKPNQNTAGSGLCTKIYEIQDIQNKTFRRGQVSQ